MEKKERASWGSRSTFILAAIGSAVGLGNAWRFPGLAAKFGGGAFLLVYVIAMLVIGVPLLTMEVSLGRHVHKGAPGAMKSMRKGAEWVGWAATSNAFFIATYYAVVFAWVLLMFGLSFKFAGMTGDSEAASNLFTNTIQTTGEVKDFGIPPILIGVLALAWILIYLCIRNGAHSVGKVVKYTVFAPVICLVIMAVKGFTMPGAMAGIAKLFIPDFEALKNPSLWVAAISQVFYSMSIMMAIMIAYGSYLDDTSHLASDVMIIAFSDLAVSVLSGIVMFTTMYGVGMTTDNMSESGIGTAFMIYPTAIVNLTGAGWFNAIFGAIFYLCLITLAIDSAFSIVEGVSTAVSDKFKLNPRKTTLTICIIAAVISVLYITRAGLAILDIVDHWCNDFSMILIGVLECIVVGWLFKPKKVLEEANQNDGRFKMPAWWFITSIKFIAPLSLAGFFVWNFVNYAKATPEKAAFVYGYNTKVEMIFGWSVTLICLLSGLVVFLIDKHRKKKGLHDDVKEWDEYTAINDANRARLKAEEK